MESKGNLVARPADWPWMTAWKEETRGIARLVSVVAGVVLNANGSSLQ